MTPSSPWVNLVFAVLLLSGAFFAVTKTQSHIIVLGFVVAALFLVSGNKLVEAIKTITGSIKLFGKSEDGEQK